jgi:hypothetical protein
MAFIKMLGVLSSLRIDERFCFINPFDPSEPIGGIKRVGVTPKFLQSIVKSFAE